MLRPHLEKSDTVEVWSNDNVVGEIRYSRFSDFVRIRWVQRLMQNPESRGAISRAYLELMDHCGVDTIRSDTTLSDKAVKFWEQLRPEIGVRKFRFLSRVASDRRMQGEKVEWEYPEENGLRVPVVARDFEFFLTRTKDYVPDPSIKEYFLEFPVTFVWDVPKELGAALLNEKIEGLESYAEDFPGADTIAALEAYRAVVSSSGSSQVTVRLSTQTHAAIAAVDAGNRQAAFSKLVKQGVEYDPEEEYKHG